MSKRKDKKQRRFNTNKPVRPDCSFLYVTTDTSKPVHTIKSCCTIEPMSNESDSSKPKTLSNLLKEVFPEFTDKIDEMNKTLDEYKDYLNNGSVDNSSQHHDISIRENVKAEKQLKRVHELNRDMINWYKGLPGRDN